MNSITKALEKARRARGKPPDLSESPVVATPAPRDTETPSEVVASAPARRAETVPAATAQPAGALPIDPREYLYLALKHRWLILAIVVIGTAATAVYTVRQTPEYKTTAVLQLSQERVRLGDEIIEGDRQQTDEFYSTHVRVLQSPAVADRVARRLKLWEHPDWGNGQTYDADPPSQVIELYAGWVEYMLSASHVSQTQLIEVYSSSEFPVLAALVANTAVREYIAFVTDRELGVAKDAASFIQDQTVKLQEQIAENKEALEKNTTSDSQRSLAIQKLQELNRQLIEAEAGSAAVRVRQTTLSTTDPSLLPEVMNDISIQAAHTRLNQLQEEYETLLSRFKEDWPEVRRVKASLEETQSRLDRQMQDVAERAIRQANAQAEEAATRENAIRNTLHRQEREIQALDQSLAQYDRRKTELEGQTQLLKSLQLRESEAGFRSDPSGRQPINAHIIQEAAVPRFPYKPNLRQNLMMGFMASLVFAFGIVAFIEMWRGSLITVDDVRRHVPAPYLGMIPHHEPSRLEMGEPSKYLLLPDGPDGRKNGQTQTFEAFKFLRTMLMSVVSRSSKTLIFLSPDKATGKTFVASNVATSLAQLGKKVLLIDADFRVPRLHKIFKVSNTLGATSILVGDAPFEDSMFQRTEVSGLFVLPAGPSPDTSSALIQAEPMQRLLHRCAVMFDYVILDSAPLLPVPDTIDVAKHCDEIVLVLRSGYTTRPAAEASLDLLQRAGRKVTGVVLNDVDLSDVSTSFHQSYRYGHGGHSYAAGAEKKGRAGGLLRGRR